MCRRKKANCKDQDDIVNTVVQTGFIIWQVTKEIAKRSIKSNWLYNSMRL
jgi:hypothetical protein